MQLNLFEDNRPGILLNSAHGCIVSRDFQRAVSIYEQLLAEYPDDCHAHAMLKLVSEWIELLPIHDAPAFTADQLHHIWLCLASLSHDALRSVALDILNDAMCVLPHPERIYCAPRFHLGQILLERGRPAEAAACFHGALSSPELPKGRFLAWRGDALTLAGQCDDAIECYLTAFLQDSDSVDIQSIKNQTILNLHSSLYLETTDEIDGQEAPAWLPVWGWLHGVFELQLHAVPSPEPDAAVFENMLLENRASAGRIWFEMLTQAERLRTSRRDGDFVALRRVMKKSNGFMFDRYLESFTAGIHG